MHHKRTKNGRAISFPEGITYGVLLAFLITILGTAAIAKLVDTELLAWESVGYGIMAVLMLSSFAGSKTAAEKVKRRKLLVCMVSAAVYFCVLLAMTALFFGGQYHAVWETMLLIIGGSGVAALMALNDKGGKRRKNRI